MSLKLDLGCGRKKIEGYIGFDNKGLHGVDVVCDLSKGIPLKDNCVNEVYSNHFLEHIEEHETLMRDIVRVCKDGAQVIVIVPFWSQECAMFSGHKVTVAPEWFRRICNNQDDINHWFPKDKASGRLVLLKIDYDWIPSGLTFCRKLGITPEEGARFLNNIASEITVKMRVAKYGD